MKKNSLRLPSKKRKKFARRRHYVREYSPFLGGTYNLPEGTREGLQKLLDCKLFWEYAEQLRVLKEKQQAVESYVDQIMKRISREIKKGKKK